MNYVEVCEVLEEKYQKIQFLRSTGNYDEAANNIRKILEMICEYYGELYHISLFKTEKYNLYEKIKFLQKNNRIDKESREAFVTLKHLGNTGSHFNRNEAVNQNQLDKALPILRNEIDKFIEKIRPNNSIQRKNVLFVFASLSEEGWGGNQNIKTEFQVHQSDGDRAPYYVENIIYILPDKSAPQFLYKYAVKNKLPLIAWDLEKRIIMQDRNEYFCHANIPILDRDGDTLAIEGHIIKDNATSEVIAYDIRCNERVFYHYDKYARQLSGIWCERKTDIAHLLQMLNLGVDLSDLQEDNLMLAFHFSLPKYTTYKVKDVYCINDENHTVAMVLSQFGEVIYEKGNVSADVKIVAGDLLRVHCLNNCIKKYLKSDERLDNWRNISKVSLRDGLYTIPFLYDYLWGFRRDGEQETYCLIDTYSDEVYSFEVNGKGVFLPSVNELLSNAPMEIDFRSLLVKMQQVGCYGLSESLIENISYEAIIEIYKSILQDEADKIEAKKRAIEEEEQRKEIAKQEYEAKQRKMAEQKALEEEKRKKEAKKRKKRIGIGVAIGLLIFGIFAAAIILPIVGVLIYNATPKYVNINDYISVEMEGYEGIGTAKVVFDYERLEADYGDRIKYNEGWTSTNGYTDFYSFFSQCYYTIEGNHNLSNGDKIQIVWNINNDDLLKYFNYGVKYEDFEYTVEGLEEMDFFDAFESLTYSIDGVSLDATLSMQNTINIDGYPGLLFTSNKTVGIANNDIITISLVTENGDDLYDYCANRFDAVPERRELEIVVSGLPEYVMSYEQITEEQLQVIIDEGEQHLCDYYNYEEDKGSSCEVQYLGNYFMVASNDESEFNNAIVMVYHIDRTIEDALYGDPLEYKKYSFYQIYMITDFSVSSEGKFIANYNKWYYGGDYFSFRYPLGKYAEGIVGHDAYSSVSLVYPDVIEWREPDYYIQNNMQNVINSNG